LTRAATELEQMTFSELAAALRSLAERKREVPRRGADNLVAVPVK
jgi:hypothetical protein